jgi:hypothetical protein
MDTNRDRNLQPEETKQPPAQERIYTPAEHERHYAPLNRELHPDDAKQFGWKAETGTVQSYQHVATHRHIHIDGPSGQFYDQQRNPITQKAALAEALGQRLSNDVTKSSAVDFRQPAPSHSVEKAHRAEQGLGI